MVKKFLENKKISLEILFALIAMLITLMVHTSVAIWYASSITTRFNNIEKIVNGDPPLNVEVATMKADIRNIKESQQRIENSLHSTKTNVSTLPVSY